MTQNKHSKENGVKGRRFIRKFKKENKFTSKSQENKTHWLNIVKFINWIVITVAISNYLNY